MGVKTTMLGRRLTANATAFRVDWSDIQQRVQLQCGFAFRVNAGAARSQGVELELGARPVDGLSLEAGFGYTDAKFTETASGTRFAKGDRVPQVPRYTLSLSTDYERSLGGERQVFGHLDYKYTSDSTSSVNPSTDASGRLIPRIRPSYTIVDARLGLRVGGVEVAFFGKNLFDERANLSDTLALAVEEAGKARVVINQPRTFGIEARQRF